jgi:hypothetical protein
LKPIFLFGSLFTTVLFANQPSAYSRPDAQNETNGKTAPVEMWPQIQNQRSYNIFAFGEFLEWRFSSPNLTYGRDGVGLSNASPAAEITVEHKGTTYYPDFQYEPGFKVGLGIEFGPDKMFDLVANYMWLHSTPESSISGSQISASFLPLNFLTSSTLTSNNYLFSRLGLNLHFNWLELQSGYTFNPIRYITLRPYISLQAIIVSGDLNARYEYLLTTTSGGATSGTYEIAKTHGHCSSWSIGPRLGLDFTIHATDRFGIYYNGSWTQQTSSITMTTKETQERPTSGTQFVIQKGNVHTNRTVGIYSLELGPTWDEWFCDKKYHFQLRATWNATVLGTGANLSFLNNNNADILLGAEFRGYNIRATFEF